MYFLVFCINSLSSSSNLFCLITVREEGYFCIWSHSVTHTQTYHMITLSDIHSDIPYDHTQWHTLRHTIWSHSVTHTQTYHMITLIDTHSDIPYDHTQWQTLRHTIWSHSVTHTQTYHMITLSDTLSRTRLDEWLVCLRDIYLATNNSHMRATPKPTVGFEPTIPATSARRPTS